MRAPRTLFRYLAREILGYGLLGFVAISVVLISQNLLRRLDDLVVVGLTTSDLTTVLACMVPMLMAYAVPVAFLFGVTLALSRLSGDCEVLAMRANGIGVHSLLVPTLAIAAAVGATTGFLMNDVEPDARREMRTLLKSVAARGGVLEAGKFRDVMGRVIFVEERDRDNRLGGILISDRTSGDQPFLIFAERGQFYFDEKAEAIRIQLQEGDLHLSPENGESDTYQRITFQRFDYQVDVRELVSGEASSVRPREMSLGELRDASRRLRDGERPKGLRETNPTIYELQFQRRLALPFAPLVFALVAVPLGLRRSPSARSWGTLLGGLLLFGFYALLSFCELLAMEGLLRAGVALWLPNLVFAATGLWLLYRVHRRGLA